MELHPSKKGGTVTGSVVTEAPEATQEEIDGWNAAREAETDYWSKRLGAVESVPDKWALDAAFNTALSYLGAAQDILDAIGGTAWRETNKDPSMMRVEYDQVGVLLGGMNECKDHAQIVTKITEKVSACALEELYAVARGAGMTFQPIFNEHGFRNN